MVRALSAMPGDCATAWPDGQTRGTQTPGGHRRSCWSSILGGGCGIVPRSRMDECQQLTQTLAAENAD